MTDLVKAEKYLVEGPPLWADGSAGDLAHNSDRIAYVECLDPNYGRGDAEVHAYDHSGHSVAVGLIDKRRLVPYTETPAPLVLDEPELSGTQKHRIHLLDLVYDRFSHASLNDITAAARWLNGES